MPKAAQNIRYRRNYSARANLRDINCRKRTSALTALVSGDANTITIRLAQPINI